MRPLKLLSIALIPIAICSNAIAGAGASGGTSVIMCVIDSKQVNVPLESFETSFTKIPGYGEFMKFIKWYSDRTPDFSNHLVRIADPNNIHWSWVPKTCDTQLFSSNPDLPISANYGVYYDGAEAVAFETYYPTVPDLQLMSLVHESVRYSLCGADDICTRFISETLLDKYKNDSGITAADLEKFFCDSGTKALYRTNNNSNLAIFKAFEDICVPPPLLKLP